MSNVIMIICLPRSDKLDKLLVAGVDGKQEENL